jgi:hypothetical protein
MALFSFLDRERTIAPPGYTRWLMPPAALYVHLCIGQAYAFSVFNLPMSGAAIVRVPARVGRPRGMSRRRSRRRSSPIRTSMSTTR